MICTSTYTKMRLLANPLVYLLTDRRSKEYRCGAPDLFEKCVFTVILLKVRYFTLYGIVVEIDRLGLGTKSGFEIQKPRI